VTPDDCDIFILQELPKDANLGQSPVMPLTVLRHRGTYAVRRVSSPAVQPGTTFVYFGIGTAAPKNFSTAGTLEGIPCPGIDASDDTWLWWHVAVVSGGGSSGTPFPPEVMNAAGVLDSKAKRRLEDRWTFLAVQAHTSNEGPDVEYAVDLRWLLQPSGRR
jgi:hypothetical protein